MTGFKKFGFSQKTMLSIKMMNFKKPTEIQNKIIPLILQNKDIIACAKTGSGKTLAYLLPIVDKLKNKTEIFGARCLILVPTRELAL